MNGEFRENDVICKIGDTSLLCVVAVGVDSYCLMSMDRPLGMDWALKGIIDRNYVLVERKGT